MATTTIPRSITAEEYFDFCQRPENRNRCFELDRGEIVELNQPGVRHGVVCANVSRILGNFTVSRGRGFVASNDAGLIVERDPDSVFGPDVFLFDEVRRYEDLEIQYEERPPVLVVEVLSPSDRMGTVMRRVSRFLEQGVKLVWIVDPDARNVTVCRNDEPAAVLEADGALAGGDVLPDLKLNVKELFAVPGIDPGAAAD